MTAPSKDNRHRKSGPLRHEFGTFGGVFTPAILTILGVIMFMRANFVVGQAGILGAVAILLIAKSITFTTSLSIGAISTNMQVRGGGSYFLISRVLGAEFGGAIGIALFFALALSVPFYILGFTEALVRSYPFLVPHFQKITFTTAVLLFFLSFVGAGWAIRTQYLIMVVLLLAIAAFLFGTLKLFSFDTFYNNLSSGYTAIGPPAKESTFFTFWTIFAIYFPAVTGIDAGLNMSGDLKNPGHSIPRGTLAAVSVGFIVYLVQILLSGGAYPRGDLIALPFDLLRDNALFGWSLAVTLGVVAATLSSALSSYLGAPRVLQAVARDRIIRFLFYFGKGSPKGDEPRRALLLTFIITLAVLFWAGNAAGGGALNVVASIITMFFLYSYGMINLAAFIEDFGDNPSFRPRFHFFHWSTALVGAAGCGIVAFLISWQAAFIAVLLILALLWYINTRHLRTAFGDARRGFVFNEVRKSLLRLARMVDDPKNWRPNILAFAGNPVAHDPLVSYAAWMESKRGLLYLAHILVGEFDELVSRRTGALNQLAKYCEEKNFEAFPLAVVADSVEEGISSLLQAATIGPIHPNLAVFGWSDKPARLNSYVNELQTARKLGMSIVLIDSDSLPVPGVRKRIDIWWRGQRNGGLMLLLAFLISENWEWHNTEIRLLRVIDKDAGREPALAALQELVDSARVEATVQTIVSDQPFADILYQHSADALSVMLGFEIPEAGSEEAWYNTYQSYVDILPTTILVNSQGEEGLLA
jgi:amino acid transporter